MKIQSIRNPANVQEVDEAGWAAMQERGDARNFKVLTNEQAAKISAKPAEIGKDYDTLLKDAAKFITAKKYNEAKAKLLAAQAINDTQLVKDKLVEVEKLLTP